MHEDDFDAMLRAGADAYGHEAVPRPAQLVRARGDQRRRRKFAGSVVLALAVVAGGGGAAYATIGRPAQPGQPVSPGHIRSGAPVTPAPATTHPATSTPRPAVTPSIPAQAATVTLRLGRIVLHAPRGWRVTYSDAQGDYTVSTGACDGAPLMGAASGSPCPTFSLIAGAGPTHGPVPTMRTYTQGTPYNTSTGVSGCPGKPYGGATGGGTMWVRGEPAKAATQGYAHVTTTRVADDTTWRMSCGVETPAGMSPASHFDQQDWYLPTSKILIVDEYSIPGLPQILAAATWR